MKHVKLFEEFEQVPTDVNTETIDKPCVDCDMVAQKIKKEIKRIDKISAKKKEA